MHNVFPRRNPLVPLIEIRVGVFAFGEFPELISLTRQQRNWLINLSGDKTATDAIELFTAQQASDSITSSTTHTSLEHIEHMEHMEHMDHMEHIVRVGLQSAGLLDSNVVPSIARWLSHTSIKNLESEMTHLHVQSIPDAATVIDRRRSLRVHVAGTNYLGASIKSLITRTGFAISDYARTASVIVLPSVSHSLVSDHDFAEREHIPHVHVGIRHTKAVVGPFVVPGLSPGLSSCVRCDYLHRRDRDPAWPERFIGWRNTYAHSTADPLLVHLTAAFSLSVLRNWIDGNHVLNLAWSATLPQPCFTAENRPPHPLCGCQLMFSTQDSD